jgi:hypothetical protein
MILDRNLYDTVPVAAVGHGTMSHGTPTEPDFVLDVDSFIEMQRSLLRAAYQRVGFRDIPDFKFSDLIINVKHKINRRKIQEVLYDPCLLTMVLTTVEQP